ncbi:MAG: hypothetical protein LBT00_05295 [Spirochaetaceae bacterium]|nr:hypothetical protein [Spirochaetaceae bacterium]
MGVLCGERASAPILGERGPRLDCFTLRVRNDDGSRVIARGARHCERSEAIQPGEAFTLDCFVASLLAMTRPPR